MHSSGLSPYERHKALGVNNLLPLLRQLNVVPFFISWNGIVCVLRKSALSNGR